MLREATSASNDDARLDHDIETVPDDERLGAELDGAPAEVRAAAVRRSRRIPEPSTMKAAWASLPLAVRDQLGVMALTESFYSFTADADPQGLTLEAGWRCERWHCEALNGITTVASAALPELFGTPGEEPLWATQDGIALVFPAQSHPSPLTEAIAVHLQAERNLAAITVRDAGDSERAEREQAEEAAYSAVIAAPLRDRADLVAFYEHLSHGCGDPGEEPLAKALEALALALQLGAAE
jgi:hypothetical protein